jgi:T5SS/PEP-CTERM-associated repeat protein
MQSRRLAAERRNKAALLFGAVAAAACPLSSRGTSDFWNGPSGSGNWSTAANWSLGHQPGNLDEVFIAATTFQGRTAVYDASATATNLSSLTIDSAQLFPASLSQAVNTLTTAVEYVGSNRTGNLNISGGMHTVNGSLYFGFAAGSSGNGSLSGGTLNSKDTFVGKAGGGFFNQTGGTHSIGTGDLILGADAGATGNYALSGGSLQVGNLSSGIEAIGSIGVGIFNQSGGVNSASKVDIGYLDGSSGTYNLSNSASLNVSLLAVVGEQGNGMLNQSGGTLSVGIDGLYIAGGLLTSGTVNLSAGQLTVDGSEVVGDVGNGAVIQSGGTHTIAGPLYVGGFDSPAGSGTFTLSNVSFGSASGTVYVGYAGKGVFNQNSGTHTAGTLYLGYNAGSSGTYTLSGGSLNVSNTGDLFNTFVGFKGTGVFNQTGGSNNIASFLILGYFAGSSGTYTLSGGTLFVASEEAVGDSGNGVFNQTGGINTTPDLGINGAVGSGAGAVGTYNLSNGATLSIGNLDIGHEGTGAFNQTGGATTVNGVAGVAILLGHSPGTGVVTLAGGTFTVLGGNEYLGLGFGGTGVFNQTGGTHTVNTSGTNGLFVGYAAGSTGTFTLSGGSLVLPAGTLHVGYQGTGIYTQSGGSNSAFTLSIGSLANGTNPPGSGIYNLSDNATLNVSTTEYVGLAGNGTLNQTGGTHTAGSVIIAASPGSGGTVNLSGGSLTAGSTFNNGVFNQTGPSLASLGPVSGTGSFVLGNDFGPLTRANVTRLDQSSLTIKFTGSLVIAANAVRFTNHVNNLQMNGGATFDLNNHELLTSTPPATIKSDLAAAYDPNGNADWSKPGLTSSLAKSNPAKFSVGYAFGGDQSAQDAGVTLHDGTPLGPTQTVARAVLTGDANMDGTVNFFDISQILGYKYNTGQPASYTDGDLNYDGVVDFFDLSVLLSANYNSGEVFGAPAAADAAEPTLAIAPEPVGVVVLAACAAATTLLRRRRRPPTSPRLLC